MLHIPALEKLVHELSRLPGIGPKTAQRLAYYILRSRDNYADRLSNIILAVKSEVHECPKCFNYTDSDLCRFCRDGSRSDDVLCLVEEPADIARIESSGAFRGRYHVLHGVISPLEGIGPAQLKIAELMARLDGVREIIVALDTDLEGDTTTLYLAKTLQGRGIKLSRIAHGVPIGSDLDFVDDRTMGRAMENRVEIEGSTVR